jgi:hypothetical protein
MGVPSLEVGYTSATTGRGGHEVHKGHVVALGEKKNFNVLSTNIEQECTIYFVQQYCVCTEI